MLYLLFKRIPPNEVIDHLKDTVEDMLKNKYSPEMQRGLIENMLAYIQEYENDAYGHNQKARKRRYAVHRFFSKWGPIILFLSFTALAVTAGRIAAPDCYHKGGYISRHSGRF